MDDGVLSTKRSRNAALTRGEILAVAGRHFAQRGYARVTLKQVADDVGVTPAMVLRYFGTKRALFEAVATAREPALPTPVGADRSALMTARARAVIDYFQDRDARASGIAVMRSLDLDDGVLFRSLVERRILGPWTEGMTGPDTELRSRLVAGILLGVGLFSLGALTAPDRPALGPREADLAVHYLARLLAVCVDG